MLPEQNTYYQTLLVQYIQQLKDHINAIVASIVDAPNRQRLLVLLPLLDKRPKAAGMMYHHRFNILNAHGGISDADAIIGRKLAYRVLFYGDRV